MAKFKRVAETKADYGRAVPYHYRSVVADLQHPLVVERNGQPIAVLISYEEYHRLQAFASDEAQCQKAAWRKLRKTVDAVHRRPTEYTSDQIEAEISSARIEVRDR